MYDTYLFDLYGTLLDIRTEEQSIETWRAFTAYLKQHGIRYHARFARWLFSRKCEKICSEPTPYRYPEYDILPAFAYLIRRKKKDADDGFVWECGEMFRKLSVRRIGLYENSLRTLDTLRQAGKRVILLSNAQLVYTKQEIEQFRLQEHLDDLFISSVEGCMKPDPEFFMAPVRKYHLDVSRCLMIGNDERSDVAGAKAAGMDCAFVKTDSAGKPLPDCKYVYPDGDVIHVLETLAE